MQQNASDQVKRLAAPPLAEKSEGLSPGLLRLQIAGGPGRRANAGIPGLTGSEVPAYAQHYESDPLPRTARRDRRRPDPAPRRDGGLLPRARPDRAAGRSWRPGAGPAPPHRGFRAPSGQG